MAYDVSALAAYTKDNLDVLVSTSLFDAKTQSLIQAEGNVLPGIKSAERIQLFETDAAFQAGGTCGFSPSGTTTFTQRTVTVGKIKINEALCPKALETKVLQSKLAAGSRYEKDPFEKQYSERKAQKIAKQLEVALWKGDTTLYDINLNKFDGLIKLIDAGSPVSGNTGSVAAGTGITQANVIAIVTAMWKAIPQAVKGSDDIRIFVGWEVYEHYVAALLALNLYHESVGNDSQGKGEFVIPGTQYKLTAVHGLDSTNRIFAMRMSNVYLGVDMLNEEERFEIFFAKEADEIRFVAEWKMGVNVAFTEEVVQFTLTA